MRSDVEERYRRGFGFSSAFTAPADHEKRHVALVGAVGWKCERAVQEVIG